MAKFEDLFDENGELLPPSKYMRNIRPEKFSDSTDRTKYIVRADLLDHALFTLTERNEHKPFENFARALAQKTVCRNLRPATGPEGGGDGKIDSETYPVSENTSLYWLEGHSADESWAVSASAKKTWKPKIKGDVKAIVETKRGYAKILAFTNQNPSQKKRKELEAELQTQYGVEVCIFDRNWLVEKTIENNLGELAYLHLGVGHQADESKNGPRDTERQQQLDEIESSLANASDIGSSSFESARLTRTAALLARGLEKPRSEIDRFFSRAEELSRNVGSDEDIFHILYDRIWTEFFWFDDPSRLLKHIDEMIRIVRDLEDSHLLKRLVTIANLLIQLPRFMEYSVDQAISKIDEIKKIAIVLSRQKERLNSALYAKSSILEIDLIKTIVTDNGAERDSIYQRTEELLDEIEGLAEFPLDVIETLIEIVDRVPRLASDAHDQLTEKYAQFIGKRDGEISEGVVYYNLAKTKLNHGKSEQAIGFLAQALTKLAKDETHALYANTLSMLAFSYEKMGLIYAARAMQLASIVALQQAARRADKSQVSKEILSAFMTLAWKCLKTGHYGDMLVSVLYVGAMSTSGVVDEDLKNRISEFHLNFDQCLACAIIVLPDEEIDHLTLLPDALDDLQLWISLSAILYKLGRTDELKNHGFIDQIGGMEETDAVFAAMAAQPITSETAKVIVATAERPVSFTTQIFGVRIHLNSSESGLEAILCETIGTGIEAFLATMLTKEKIVPITDLCTINVIVGDSYSFDLDTSRQVHRLVWPRHINVVLEPNNSLFFEHFREVLCIVLATCFRMENVETLLDQMLGEERAFERAAFYSNITSFTGRVLGNTTSALGRDFMVISPNGKEYKANSIRPVIIPDPDVLSAILEDTKLKTKNENHEAPDFSKTNHQDIVFQSPINLSLWDIATWKGMLFASLPDHDLPVLALMFEDSIAGYRIFENWRERYGSEDQDDEIRVSILKGIEAQNPAHYRGAIGANPANMMTGYNKGKTFMIISRRLTMEPRTTENLSRFENCYRESQAFLLAPVIFDPIHGPIPAMDVAIKKNNIHIEDAWRIGLDHPDAILFTKNTSPFIPNHVTDVPCIDLITQVQQVGNGKPVKFGKLIEGT